MVLYLKLEVVMLLYVELVVLVANKLFEEILKIDHNNS